MKIHEYQAKEILRKYNVPVPGGEMATTLEQADTAAKALFAAGNAVVVVKAQIHAGGRGKGGGVKVVRNLDDANAASKAILGMQLITHQTGPAGQKVQRLLIEEGSAIERELYLGLVLDRATAKVVFMASQSGGMEIEEVAHATPELIYKEAIDRLTTLTRRYAADDVRAVIAAALGMEQSFTSGNSLHDQPRIFID